jgi:hypothetical protein
MPDYQITMPDGGKYKISGPEGFTEQQAFETLQGKIKSESTLLGDIGTGIKDVGIGLGRAAAGTYAAMPSVGPKLLKGLDVTGGLKKQAKEFAAEPSQSVAQTAGEVAGNVLPYTLTPEVGAGKAALQYGLQYGLPAGLTAAALAKTYMTHGVMGIVNLAAAAGMGKLTLNKYLPHLLQLAKTHAEQIAGTLGRPLEQVGLGAATTAARQGESNGKDQ